MPEHPGIDIGHTAMGINHLVSERIDSDGIHRKITAASVLSRK
jgi:hypothetical protein